LTTIVIVIPERHPESSSITLEGNEPAKAIDFFVRFSRLSLRIHEMGAVISFCSDG